MDVRQTLALLLLVLPMKFLAQYAFASMGIPLFVGEKMGGALRGLREYKEGEHDPWDEFRKWMWTVEDTPVRVDDKWLEAASEKRHIDIMRFLLENGAHVNSMKDSGANFIRSAAKDRRADVVRLLGEHGAAVDEPGVLGTAASNGHVEVVHVIARLGGDVNAPDSSGSAPVHIAARNGHVEVAHAIARLGGDVSAPAPVHIAGSNRYVEVVCALARLGGDVNASNHAGLTPISNAVRNEHLDVVRALIDLGANLTEKDLDAMAEFAMTQRKLGNYSGAKMLLANVLAKQ
ncbi:hypothetical protein MVEN_01140400 [Mycena venus]|uniref:Ankyrin repeat domain-containing protein n=1 Tax=Mycena venus TaxID=2733690 RepID=A0A8H6Y5E2_9AGAR|nr:hypothetical protein MVEN_01140400 [Mycena venus]